MLWLPSARGRSPTSQPLPSDMLHQDFVPESPWTRFAQYALRRICCNSFSGWLSLGILHANVSANRGECWLRLAGLRQYMDGHGTTEATWLRGPASRRRLPGLGRDQSIEITTSSCQDLMAESILDNVRQFLFAVFAVAWTP